jgi:hypothetical protein
MIYLERPDIVIGTVDKFAQMPWNEKTRALFGFESSGNRIASPPNLIIQDELHLISGPLGSMAGLYEVVIQDLCTDHRKSTPIRPKIVASTATVARYQQQIQSLFGRNQSVLFPPPVIDSEDNFFARIEKIDGKNAPGRKFVGVFAPGFGSFQTIQVRVGSSLMQSPLKLAEEDKNIHLHVHSSFKMYGWDDRDQPYEHLYEICRQHPQITYHGFTKYEDLVPKLRDEYHIFAYPNIWAETMCRAILESMYYGLVCVHPDLAAITDTTGGLNKYMYNGTHDHNQHVNLHYHHLKNAIIDVRENSDNHIGSLQFNREYIQRRYGTDHVHEKWTKLLQELNDEYPTIESRALPTKKHFVYRTV